MNSYIQTDETEIDLLDLAKYLLHRIGWILLVGVLCAAAFGVFKYLSSSSVQEDPDAAVKAEAGYELDLEKYEQESELIHTADESTIELIRSQREYLETAPYMQLDSNHVWKAQAYVRVITGNRDFPAYQIEELYKFELNNTDYLEDLAKERGTEAASLRELVSWWSIGSAQGTGDSTSDVILREENYDDRMTTKIFCVQGMGNTKDDAQGLLDVMLEELQKVYKTTASEYLHEMNVISQVCVETVDTGIRTAQRDRVTLTQSLLYQLKDNTDKAALLSKPDEIVSSPSGGVSKKTLVKFGLIGFVLGVFVMCLCFAIRYIRNDRLVSYEDIGRKGILLKDLGLFASQGADVVSANIRNFAADRRKLFLTGLSSETEFVRACSSLKEQLPDFEVVFARNVVEDPKAKDLLLDCEAVVLVEQKGTTLYSGMKQEITFLVNAGKEIVGVVIL